MQFVSVHYAGQHRTPSLNYLLESPSTPQIASGIQQQEACKQWVDSIMDKLSLREKIGQLFIYTIAPLDTKHNLNLLHEAVSTYDVGGLLFSGGQLQTQAALTNRAQGQAKVPLLITFDGEWGLAMRLKGTPNFPRNMVLGCITNDSLIYEYGKEMARQCKQMGVQVNFAPVADVNINPKNPVINTRSFGEDPQMVAQKVIAYGKGLESGNVLSVSKHFPGHGDTDKDSHYALPVLPFSRQRLDSIEIYPFDAAIRAGLSGMMVGHLCVPALEKIKGLPASLSRSIVTDLLTDELGFKGLVFTDALAMKGVAGNKDVSLLALKAGNDMVLAPRNLKEEIDAVVRAVHQGDFSREEVDAKCRKVLTYKYALGLYKKPHIQQSGLENRINTPYAQDLVKRLNLAAITVLSNKQHTLPLPVGKEGEKNTIALLQVEGKTSLNPFKQAIEKYAPLRSFKLTKALPLAERRQLIASLSDYAQVVVAISENNIADFQSFFNELAASQSRLSTIYICFAQGKALAQIEKAVAQAQAVVLAHSPNVDVQTQVANVLFGKATADGRLSASIGNLFTTGDGVTITPETSAYVTPRKTEVSAVSMDRVDAIAKEGIAQGAYPGCQIAVMKDGELIYQKSFGTHQGAGSQAVQNSDLYDLASLTKTSATLLALMKLYDGGRFNLSDRISQHLTWLKGSNKENITIRELLYHQSGLPASITSYQNLIDKDSYAGRLYSNRRDSKYTVQVGNTLWANPDFKFFEGMTSPIQTTDCSLQVSEGLWVHKSFADTIRKNIIEVPLKTKQYRYSDVGFVLLYQLAEQLAGVPMDKYLQQNFYEPMGLERTTYLPLQHFAKEEIVPSSHDRFVRKEVLRGYVHDETAAFQGGVTGSAGLFSNAAEVASIYQMLLDGGVWRGKRYLSEETCRLFTTEKSKVSRRGLGFDKPEPNPQKTGPCSPSTPNSAFGHTGFTGTCVWADPSNNLVYVFLSNRIYPSMLNRKLMQLDIRPNIQEAIYEALGRKKK